jgi:chitodextrinase
MGATPKTGAVTFRGLSSGTTYNVALYNADTNGTYCRLDNGSGTPGAAGGSDIVVFNEPVTLIDCSFVTGIVDTANLRVMADYKPTSYVINWANCVNTLSMRTPLNVGFKAGTRIGFMQIP